MSDSQSQAVHRKRRKRPAALLVALAALVLAVTFAAVAFAAGTVTVGSASNSTLGERVAVNAQGRTLYALSPETAKHLLCKSSACLKLWPPLTVPSSKTELKLGSGVQGHLAILHRSGGVLQVTLRGVPLYRFSLDQGKDESNGEGIKSFGGTWHAVSATSSPGTTTPSAPTTSTPSAEPPYGY